MGIYQHFREEEHPFIDQVFSWLQLIQRTYEFRLTDFLDPREREIVKAVIGTDASEFQLHFFGGSKKRERQRAIIAPFYEEITEDHFQIALLEGRFHERFVSLSHPDIMGSFLSLGIDRSKLGDIIVADGIFQFLTDQAIVPYLMSNLVSVKQAKVKLREKPLEEILETKDQWSTNEKVVPSLRLDAVLRSMHNMSRKQATMLIERGHVKVNYKTVDQLAYSLEEGDLISARGKGRGKLLQVLGRTRKDNLKVKVALLRND